MHRFFQGAAALNFKIEDLDDPKTGGPDDIKLEEVRLHLSAAAAGNTFTITLENVTRAEFNSVLATQDMTGLQDFDYLPTKAVLVRACDHLIFDWANDAGAMKIWGIEVIYRRAEMRTFGS